MKRALALALVVLLAVGGGLVASRLFGKKLLRFPYLTGPAQSVLPAGWDVRTLDVGGATLRYAVRPPRGAATWLVFAPGNDERQLQQGATFLSRVAGEADVGLLTFAARGYDGSTGTPSPDVVEADALRVMEAVKLEPRDTTLIGYSLGSFTAVRAAAAWSRGGRPPRKLVLLAAATELAMLPQVPWAKALQGDVYEQGSTLAGVTCPVEVQHGVADAALPPSMGEALAAQAKVKAVLLDGVDHAGILERATPSL